METTYDDIYFDPSKKGEIKPLCLVCEEHFYFFALIYHCIAH